MDSDAHLRSMKCRDLAALLARDGWRLTRIRGAHHHFRHFSKGGVVMIPGAENDVLSPKALRSVLRRAELSSTADAGTTARFLMVIEPTVGGFSAYAPDLVGCVSTGKSVEEVEASMREAISGHLEELRDNGSPIPSPSVSVTYIDVTV